MIVGFGGFDVTDKRIFEYDDIKGDAHELKAKNINPYLIDAPDILIERRSETICVAPKMYKGSQPTDDGNLLLSKQEKDDLIKSDPSIAKFIRPFISAHEFLNGLERYCLWLVECDPKELKAMPLVMERIENVRKMRLKSKKNATVQWATKPTIFTENRQPSSNYILIPRHSSENRYYIPMGFCTKDDIAADSCLIIPNGSLFHFGTLMSKMHMAWVSVVCGRLKSDYRYSANIVYNNYPWPENPTKEQVAAIERAAQRVLEVRNEYPGSSLADLYDPLTMPPLLVGAHQALDRAVDLAYRPQPFLNDTKRMEYLFELYEKYLGSLFHTKKKR